jgi:predicted transcriptional regulator
MRCGVHLEAVHVIKETETITLLADMVRRQILRTLSAESLTQAQLAKKLMLSEPTVAHHLKLLKVHGLVRVESTKIESHGIRQKFYAPMARLFIEDWNATPLEQRRYYVLSHMDRLRGILSVFELLAEERKLTLLIKTQEVESLAESLAKRISTVAERHLAADPNLDREALLAIIFAETLKEELATGDWSSLTWGFKDVMTILTNYKKNVP